MIPVPNPYADGNCFYCGPRNPIGFKLRFFLTETEPKEMVCRLKPSPNHCGLGRAFHGGLMAGLFDEIMGWSSETATGSKGVTARIEVEYLKPVYTDQEIEVRCRVETIDGRKVHLSTEITDAEGEVCSRAKGLYITLESEQFDRLVKMERRSKAS